jgi:hypothetical protein
MGQWSKVNTTPSLKERLTGKKDGKVIRSWSLDQEMIDAGINPDAPKKLSRKEQKAADAAMVKQPRRKR